MEGKGARTISIGIRESIVLACIALMAAGIILTNHPQRTALSSSETRFVEKSPGGLQIVPASCPSSPHYSGQCSGIPCLEGATGCYCPPGYVLEGDSCVPPSSGPSCDASLSISASPASITSGGTSQITWSASGVNSCGVYVTDSDHDDTSWQDGTSGSHSSGNRYENTTFHLSCVTACGRVDRYATLTVSNAPPPLSCSSSCGTIANGASRTFYLASGAESCQSQVRKCTNGTLSGSYQSCSCTQQCVDHFYCQGNDLRNNNNCSGDHLIQQCVWQCSPSGCIPPPPPQASISASPALIHSGSKSQITWSSQYTTACSVAENNPEITDAWSGLSDTKPSSALGQQTKYTLTCTGIDGSSITKFVVVNIIPVWQEQ